MRVVRQRMIKTFKSNTLPLLGSLTTILLFSSCNPTELPATGQKSALASANGALTNKAYIYRESPSILGGSSYGPAVNMAQFLDYTTPEFITSNTQLKGNCSLNVTFNFVNYPLSTTECISSQGAKDPSEQTVPRNSDGTWIFGTGSREFYQTNALYHIQRGINSFLTKLSFAYNVIQNSVPITVPKSVPAYVKDSGLYWFKAITPNSGMYFQNSFLTSYALCNYDKNASFSPSGPELCFGFNSEQSGFYFVQDPSVVYHELGHAFVSVMMNMRNGTSSSDYHIFRSNMGALGYSERGAINEGLADYFSYVMTKRTHMGEWALGRLSHASRPMSEDDPIHISGVDTTSEGRLSYPLYLLYDPNEPDVPFEDIHMAGQITSHYLVALTKSLKTECSLGDTDAAHDTATSYVLLLLAETLSELGDLKAKGIDSFGAPYVGPYFFNNLDSTSSYLWTQQVNAPTYRRFFQVFAKNIYKYISGTLCPSFTKNESEKLLDDYGLLLFKTYNDNGNSTKDRTVKYNNAVGFIAAQPLTPVSESNRRKSVLVSKELIDLATPSATQATYYIIDDRESINSYLSNLLFKGFPVNLSTNVASTDYNNNNVRISPGEIVAIIPNLFNSSNSTMAGVQLLANDWDHVHVTDTTNGNFKPCVIDSKTTADQGGETANTCTSTMTSFKRLVKQANNLFPTEAAAPVCLVELASGNTSRWVSQNEFRKKNGLSLLDKDCLGFSTNGTSTDEDFTFNPHECLVRILPGANEANFSKIDSQKSFSETVRGSNTSQKFNIGNSLLLEVNKWIPPGTKFRCRLRAKFSNCSDCFTDPADASLAGDDYLDSDYNGSKPFKVINFDFEVND